MLDLLKKLQEARCLLSPLESVAPSQEQPRDPQDTMIEKNKSRIQRLSSKCRMAVQLSDSPAETVGRPKRQKLRFCCDRRLKICVRSATTTSSLWKRDISYFAWRYRAALSERMFALVRCSRYLGGALEGVPAEVTRNCESGQLRNLAASSSKV